MSTLLEKMHKKQTGILTYGMTPPRETHTHEKIVEIANKQFNRLKDLNIDGLILYDIQDEADRTDKERPFPYFSTIDPSVYSKKYLGPLSVPKIIYRSVGKYSEEQLSQWIQEDPEEERYTVYVGPSSSKQQVQITLPEAYTLSKQENPQLTFGGVVIPERHINTNDEHLRVVRKVQSGCSFFVSQAVYNVEASKNVLSDYSYYCKEHGIDTVPILINLAPCGSKKTLEFMKWLGISIPKWLENDLKYSNDILDKSIQLCREIFAELFTFGAEKGIPVGCSIESVSTRKVEIEASISLVEDVQSFMQKHI